MRVVVAIVLPALAILPLSGCGTPPPVPGINSPSYSDNHSTAAGGNGLGPDGFKTNGGAFGPDETGH